METPSRRYGFTVFCDDIRQEVGGKTSFIGVYQDELIIQSPSLPVTLPKLCFHIVFQQDGLETIPEAIFEIWMPDNTEQPARKVEVKEIAASPNLAPDADNLRIMLGTCFSPVPITKEGRIQVLARCGDEEIRLGTLLVRHQPPPSTQSNKQ